MNILTKSIFSLLAVLWMGVTQAKDILDIGVLVAAPEAHLRTRKAQKATKGGKGQKSTKSPKAAPSQNPSAAPSAAPSLNCGDPTPTDASPTSIRSLSSGMYLDGVSSDADNLLFLSNEFKDVGEWWFDELETGTGEYTIQNSKTNMYMDGRSPSELGEVGKVMVRSWDGSILPVELVWEVEKVVDTNSALYGYYTIKSKSSGGYLDGRNVGNIGATIVMKQNPEPPPSENDFYMWIIEPSQCTYNLCIAGECTFGTVD